MPKTNATTKRKVLPAARAPVKKIVEDSGSLSLSNMNANNIKQDLPKGYAKVVERMRKVQEDKCKEKIEEEKKNIGERYGKERLEKMKPPSFLARG
jgi:hypothetical protein